MISIRKRLKSRKGGEDFLRKMGTIDMAMTRWEGFRK